MISHILYKKGKPVKKCMCSLQFSGKLVILFCTQLINNTLVNDLSEPPEKRMSLVQLNPTWKTAKSIIQSNLMCHVQPSTNTFQCSNKKKLKNYHSYLINIRYMIIIKNEQIYFSNVSLCDIQKLYIISSLLYNKIISPIYLQLCHFNSF